MSIYGFGSYRAPGFRSIGSGTSKNDEEDKNSSLATINQPQYQSNNSEGGDSGFGGNQNTNTGGSVGGLSGSDVDNSKSPGIGINDIGWGAATLGAYAVNPALGVAVSLGRGLSKAFAQDPADFATPGINPAAGVKGIDTDSFGIDDATQVDMPDNYGGGWSNPNDFGGPTGYGDVEVGGYGVDQTGADLGDDDLGATDTDPGPGINSGPSSVSHSGPDAGAAAGMANSGHSDFGGVGGGGTGGGDTRVICTELVRQGRMLKRDQLRDLRFTQKYLTDTHIRGYHLWAIPTVRLMKKSDTWAAIWKFIAQHRANEISHLMGCRDRPDYIGKLLRHTFEPVCFLVGLCVPASKQLTLSEIKERIE